jgi:hypothetical protein
MGGWGLNDEVMFGHALAAKLLWVFLMKESLWEENTYCQNISHGIMVDWIQ